MIQDATNDGGNGNSCYFIVNFLRSSGSSEVLLYCWCAAFFVVLNSICVCCVGNIINYFMGGQLAFDWDRLEKLLVTRD